MSWIERNWTGPQKFSWLLQSFFISVSLIRQLNKITVVTTGYSRETVRSVLTKKDQNLDWELLTRFVVVTVMGRLYWRDGCQKLNYTTDGTQQNE